jgi:hypothetical protein
LLARAFSLFIARPFAVVRFENLWLSVQTTPNVRLRWQSAKPQSSAVGTNYKDIYLVGSLRILPEFR